MKLNVIFVRLGRHSSAHRRRSSSNLLQNSNHPLPVSPVGFPAARLVSAVTSLYFSTAAVCPTAWAGPGRPSPAGGAPTCLSWAASPVCVPAGSPGERPHRRLPLSLPCSVCGAATPPSSLLQQTFNNVVSAATSLSNSGAYRGLKRNQTYDHQ